MLPKRITTWTGVVCCLLCLASCASILKPTTANPCFSPHGGCTQAIAEEIEKAKSEVLVQAYSLTSKPIADAIVNAKEAGVHVEIILDRSYGYTQNSASYFSTLKGIPTYIDAKHVVAQNNILIIDRNTVITGSFTFTHEAEEKNAGNLVIIDSAKLARTYLKNWNDHKSHSQEFRQKAPAKSEARKKEKGAGEIKRGLDGQAPCATLLIVFFLSEHPPYLLNFSDTALIVCSLSFRITFRQSRPDPTPRSSERMGDAPLPYSS